MTNLPDSFQTTFKGTTGTPEIEAEIRAWLEKLAPLRADVDMTGGKIAIEAVFEHQRNRQGYRYQVQMNLRTVGAPLIVSSDEAGNGPHDDVYVAIRNGFRSVRRQLLERGARPVIPPSPSIAPSVVPDSVGVLAPPEIIIGEAI